VAEQIGDRLLVFTDLDGTLLDHYNYRADGAAEGLALLAQRQIPVIFNTSKTLPECLNLAQQLNLDYPFIVENGSAICLTNTPDNADLLQTLKHDYPTVQDNSARVTSIVLGVQHSFIAAQVSTLARTFKFLSLTNSSIRDTCEATGLTPEQAARARQRQYSEPLLWQDSPEKLHIFREQLAGQGLTLLRGGRFYHVLGQTDKGHALRILRNAYSNTPAYQGLDIRSIALGDSHNDLAMLQAADMAVLIRSPAHRLPEHSFNTPLLISTHNGPRGWSECIRLIAGEH
jgi:mannosyl-3-phosphoglycerate phosphatase